MKTPQPIRKCFTCGKPAVKGKWSCAGCRRKQAATVRKVRKASAASRAA